MFQEGDHGRLEAIIWLKTNCKFANNDSRRCVIKAIFKNFNNGFPISDLMIGPSPSIRSYFSVYWLHGLWDKAQVYHKQKQPHSLS